MVEAAAKVAVVLVKVVLVDNLDTMEMLRHMVVSMVIAATGMVRAADVLVETNLVVVLVVVDTVADSTVETLEETATEAVEVEVVPTTLVATILLTKQATLDNLETVVMV